MSATETNKALENPVFKSKYRFIKSVGKGSFGEAVLVRSKVDGRRYITKAIDSASMTDKEKHDVQNEIKILSKLVHTNIVRYLEHFTDESFIYIVMEYADGGDLNTKLREQRKKGPDALFDPKLAMFWFLQICMALKYLHDHHILHRDLKTANVFLTSNNIVKLGDFGISTTLQNTIACAKTVCGTPYYFSPELCQSKPYNNKSDVWALGVIFYECLTLQRPFNARSLKELLKKVLSGQYEPIPSSVPSEMRQLCASLLTISSTQRPNINRVIESPFVQEQLKSFSTQLENETKASGGGSKFNEATAAPATRVAGSSSSSQPASPNAGATKATPAPAPAKPATTQQPTPAAAPAQRMSDKDQRAMLRGLGREGIKALAEQQKSAINAEIEAQRKSIAEGGPAIPAEAEEADGHPDNDEDDSLEAKQRMINQAKEVVGKPLGGHEEEFGDGPSDSSPVQETITMANGTTVPANTVRALLEAEMGLRLLGKAADFVSDMLASPGAPNAVEIQRDLCRIIGSRYAHHANAIAKLAIWESKSE